MKKSHLSVSKKAAAFGAVVSLVAGVLITSSVIRDPADQSLHAAAGDQYLSVCAGISAPDVVMPNEVFGASVYMKNTGTPTWDAAKLYRLGSQNAQDNKTWGMNRVEMTMPTTPGNSTAFMFNAKAPATPGAYSFSWKMVQDGVVWFGETCTKTITVKATNNAICNGITAPATVTPGQQFDVQVNMQNTGNTKWTPDAAYRLGSQNAQDNKTWGMNRISVPFGIAPNYMASFIFKAIAPQTAGTYNFDWQMVQDGVEWFGTKCTKAITVTAASSSSSAVSSLSSAISSSSVTSTSSQMTSSSVASSVSSQASSQTSSSISSVKTGSLYVTRYFIPVKSRQLLGGALGPSILQLEFFADGEAIDVTNLQFNSSGSLARSVDRLELYKMGATTPFATATAGACESDDVLTTNNGNGGASISAFCARMTNQQLVIAHGTVQNISVMPRLKSDEHGAVSNETIQFWMTKQAVSNNVTGSGAVRARGLTSSNNLVANNGNTTAEGEIFIGTETPGPNKDILGSVNKSVLSKITSISNANPDANNTNVPTGISPIGQFKFDTAVNTNTLNGLNKVVLSDFIFTINRQNVTMSASDFKFYNKADPSTKTPCSVISSSVTDPVFYVLCQNLSTVVETRIASGASGTFVLEANIIHPKVTSNPSALQVSLRLFNSTISSMETSANHMRWVDQDTSGTAFLWVELPELVIPSTLYRS